MVGFSILSGFSVVSVFVGILVGIISGKSSLTLSSMSAVNGVSGGRCWRVKAEEMGVGEQILSFSVVSVFFCHHWCCWLHCQHHHWKFVFDVISDVGSKLRQMWYIAEGRSCGNGFGRGTRHWCLGRLSFLERCHGHQHRQLTQDSVCRLVV